VKLLFSEQESDYDHYQFPYAVLAVPEPGEAPADLFEAGFLPWARGLDRFYLCRNVRVQLAKFQTSSENRRILRKGEGIAMKLVPRAEFDFTPARRERYLQYAEARFGRNVMPPERLELVFHSPVTTHLLVFTDTKSDAEVGVVVLYLEAPRLGHYRFAFYDLDYFDRNLGMFMMTSAVAFFAERGFKYLYLGTCYSQKALYKTQFVGAEFFNGFLWSDDLAELKFIINRDQKETHQHLLENGDYLNEFYSGDLKQIAGASAFQVKLK